MYKFIERCNFNGFYSQLVICKIFILKITLAKFWLASIGEQDTYEQLCLTSATADGKF